METTTRKIETAGFREQLSTLHKEWKEASSNFSLAMTLISKLLDDVSEGKKEMRDLNGFDFSTLHNKQIESWEKLQTLFKQLIEVRTHYKEKLLNTSEEYIDTSHVLYNRQQNTNIKRGSNLRVSSPSGIRCSRDGDDSHLQQFSAASGSLVRTISLQPEDYLIRRDEMQGVVGGFQSQAVATRPAVTNAAYSAVSWSISYEEIASMDQILKADSQSQPDTFKIRIRGKDAYAKQYNISQAVAAAKVNDLYEYFQIETTDLISKLHMNLAEYYGTCTDKALILVREWFPNGSLLDILSKNNINRYKLSFWRKMNIAQSVASAMDFVLKNKFTNPNLKPSNIMFDSFWDVKLADQSFQEFNQLEGNSSHSILEQDLMIEYSSVLWSLVTETELPLELRSNLEEFEKRIPCECPQLFKKLILDCASQNPYEHITFSNLVNSSLFDDIFYQASVGTANICSNLWNSLGLSEVPWKSFFILICQYLQIEPNESNENTLEFNCLRAMLDVQGNQGNVTIITFSRLVRCIGPFIEGTEIIDQVKALLEASWFLGSITASEAEVILDTLPPRSFLVRFSSNTGEFSLSFKQKDQVLHSRVPVTAKYNLHQYIKLLIQRKKFEETPKSPYKELFDRGLQPLFNYVFIR